MKVYFFSLGFATGLQGERARKCVRGGARHLLLSSVFSVCVAECSAAQADLSVCEVIRQMCVFGGVLLPHSLPELFVQTILTWDIIFFSDATWIIMSYTICPCCCRRGSRLSFGLETSSKAASWTMVAYPGRLAGYFVIPLSTTMRCTGLNVRRADWFRDYVWDCFLAGSRLPGVFLSETGWHFRNSASPGQK